jgi:hypothetical protein
MEVLQAADSRVKLWTFRVFSWIMLLLGKYGEWDLTLLPYLLTYLLTHSLTPHSTVLLEKLTGLQPIKKFPVFYGTTKFITAFTSARHLSLSWASLIQSTHPHPTSWSCILIISSHLRLGLPSGLFPSGSPITLYTPHRFSIRATYPAHLIPFYCITRTNWTPVQLLSKHYIS